MKRSSLLWIVILAGRVTGIGMLVMILAFIVGEGFPNLAHQPFSVIAEFSMLFLLIAGLLTGLLRPLYGAGMMALALVGFNTVEIIMRHHRLAGGAFLLFWVPVILYTLTYFAQRGLKHSHH